MIILADETLEVFFDQEFAQSFRLTEMPIERQNSLSREIFDSLFAAGTKFATGRGSKRQGLSTSSSKTPSTTTLSSLASATTPLGSTESSQITVNNSQEPVVQAETVANGTQVSPKVEAEEEEDDEDVLEEVDRLLDEFEKS
jgi:hypothetical protein